MKKLVIAALAIGAMAACTKSNVQFEQPGEISFQPVAQKATKAGAVASTTYPKTSEYDFNVWAWWGDNNATIDETYSMFTSPYIAAGKFTYRTGNVWGGSTPYYWPTTGSLVFAGYSPAVNDGGTFNYILAEKKFTVTKYKQSSDPETTKDLMWFDVTSNSYNTRKQDGSAVTQVSVGEGVPVTFKHALSWLSFKLNVANNDLNKNWTVTSVTLNQIKTIGNCEATKSAAAVAVATWNFVDVIQEEKPMAVFNGSKEVEYKTEPDVIDNGGVVVIPQACTSVTITFTQKNYVGGSTPSQTITLPLNAGTDSDKWLSGKHYIYTIVFSADEILITPIVAEWVPEIVDDIPVQY